MSRRDESIEQRRLLKLACRLAIAAALLQGCGDGAGTSGDATSASDVSTSTVTPVTSAPVATRAKEVGAATESGLSSTSLPPTTQAAAAVPSGIDPASAYLRRCGGCHGAEGTSQSAQTLAGAGSLPESYVLEVVMMGSGSMPAFGESLDRAEIDAIVAYIRESF